MRGGVGIAGTRQRKRHLPRHRFLMWFLECKFPLTSSKLNAWNLISSPSTWESKRFASSVALLQYLARNKLISAAFRLVRDIKCTSQAYAGRKKRSGFLSIITSSAGKCLPRPSMGWLEICNDEAS